MGYSFKYGIWDTVIPTQPKTWHLATILCNWPSDDRLIDQVFLLYACYIMWWYTPLFLQIVIPWFPCFLDFHIFSFVQFVVLWQLSVHASSPLISTKIIMYLFPALALKKKSPGFCTIETIARLKGWRQKIRQKLKEKLLKGMTALFVIFWAIIYEISFHFESSLIFSHFNLRYSTHECAEDRRPLKMIQSGGICNEAAGCRLDFIVFHF